MAEKKILRKTKNINKKSFDYKDARSFLDEMILLLNEKQLSEIVFKKNDVNIVLRKDHLSSLKQQVMENETDIINEPVHIISSHTVGIFRLSSNDEDESPIRKGDIVEKGQILGFIDSVNATVEVTSPYLGIIEEIFLDNETAVEYGQQLMKLKEIKK